MTGLIHRGGMFHGNGRIISGAFGQWYIPNGNENVSLTDSVDTTVA